MRAVDVFHQNNGEVTKRYYAELGARGLMGELAVALFRAQKRSTAAKAYRGRRFSREAYDVKNWSLAEICRIAPRLGSMLTWGWGRDEKTVGFPWVLYLDLPQGQVSFHSPTRLSGPDYPGSWDGKQGASDIRILAFCDSIPFDTTLAVALPPPIPPPNDREELIAADYQWCKHTGECVVYAVRASGVRMAVCAECLDVLKKRCGASLLLDSSRPLSRGLFV